MQMTYTTIVVKNHSHTHGFNLFLELFYTMSIFLHWLGFKKTKIGFGLDENSVHK